VHHSRNGNSRTSARAAGQPFQYPPRTAAHSRANRRDAKTACYRCAKERNDRPRIRCEAEAAASGHTTGSSPATSCPARRPAPTARASTTRRPATHHPRTSKARSSRSRKILEEPGPETSDMYSEWAAEGYVQRQGFLNFWLTYFANSLSVKRALRALESPDYTKARKKNPLLPEITDRASLENTFKLLPLSLLALRVSKIDPHEGHDHAPGAHKTKRVKGLWTVKIEQQQECREELHFVWLYEGSQIKTKLYAAGFLAIVFAIVMFPLWPMKMRLGVWYLSMGMLGLIGLFFAMAIFRLILFAITMFAVPPGLWLYPNLFEDVGFFDSFRPVWGWQEVIYCT